MTIISGETQEAGHIIIMRHDDWTTEHMQEVAAGSFKIKYLSPGTKDVIFRRQDGQLTGYGLITPYEPTTAGSMYATGNNAYGQLGLNNVTTMSYFTVVGEESVWKDVVTGPLNSFTHSIALRKDGTMWGCGYNSYGQLGLNDRANRSTFTQIGSDNDWLVVEAGIYMSYAIKNDGSLWGTGGDSWGEFGLGTNTAGTRRSTLTRIGSDNNWVQISVSSHSCLALKSDGTIWSWGYGTDYNLGHSSAVHRSTPTKIGTDTDWQKICIGLNSAAIKNNGTLWCWGTNTNGEHGRGDRTQRALPYQTGALTNWVGVFNGSNLLYFLNTDGELYASGYLYAAGCNLNGYRSTPTMVVSDDPWLEVSPGLPGGVGIKDNGTIWGWGSGASGLLGLGPSAGVKLTPVQIGTDTDWKSIHCKHSYSSFAIK